MTFFERLFEALMWNSRLIVLVAVLSSLIVSIAMFYIATVDVVGLVAHVLHYHQGATAEARSTAVTHVVEVVDGYLLAAIMFIFALGLYELFISKIDIAEKTEFGSRLLLIQSLDDLKDRLAKVVLLILVVKFFEYALQLHFSAPLDLLYLAIGIFLIAGALFLSHAKVSREKH